MAIIQFVLALVIMGILYARMIKREIPGPIGTPQAVVPVVLGMISTPFATMIYIAISYIFVGAGYSGENLPILVRSIIASILAAGIPEEAGKLIMMLITFRIFRSKIRNVYEYIMIGGAVGFGFTLLEEFLYGSGGNIANLIGRFITLAGHMVFGMIMAKHLGLARINKSEGRSSGSEIAKAILIPFTIHVIYDTFTANNRLLASDNDMTMVIGLVMANAVIIALFVIQCKVLINFKKDAEKYSNMMFS